MRKMDIVYLVTDLYITYKSGGNFQEFINRRYRSDKEIAIGKSITQFVVDDSFSVYHTPGVFNVIDEVKEVYDFSDLRSTDILLDIGANVGTFSLIVHDKVKQVYAIEPLYFAELNRNIQLNKIKNIHTLEYSLANEDVEISYTGRKKLTHGKSLTQLREMCGWHVDFLKCDCEGGEWIIKPEELKGIRRIEAEVHRSKGKHLNDFPEMLKSIGYYVKIDNFNKFTSIVHAVKH
jgi:FkbM family methyltransferase